MAIVCKGDRPHIEGQDLLVLTCLLRAMRVLTTTTIERGHLVGRYVHLLDILINITAKKIGINYEQIH